MNTNDISRSHIFLGTKIIDCPILCLDDIEETINAWWLKYNILKIKAKNFNKQIKKFFAKNPSPISAMQGLDGNMPAIILFDKKTLQIEHNFNLTTNSFDITSNEFMYNFCITNNIKTNNKLTWWKYRIHENQI